MTSGFFQISSNIQINIAVGETFYRQRIPSIDSNLFIILEIPAKTLSPIENILMAHASFLLSIRTILYVTLKTDPTHAKYKEASDD